VILPALLTGAIEGFELSFDAMDLESRDVYP